MAGIVLDDVSKVYADGTTAVSELNLNIGDGEFMVLVGPSGCGKTTALRMVAGLEHISGGAIRIGERVVNDVPPKERDIAMVFQNYALYPHMTVYDNMAFGLKLQKMPKAEIDERVRQAATILGLEEYLAAQAESALRRSASARGDGPGDRAAPPGLPDGRAVVQPRRQAPGADAIRDRTDPARPRRDHDLRHARPGRGHDHGRPGRRDPQGRAPTGGYAADVVRPSEQPVRGGLHRIAGDEPARRLARSLERLADREARRGHPPGTP